MDALDCSFIEEIFPGAGQLREFFGGFDFAGFDPRGELLFGDASLAGGFFDTVHLAILSRTVRADGLAQGSPSLEI
jgi:hypothetical protein